MCVELNEFGDGASRLVGGLHDAGGSVDGVIELILAGVDELLRLFAETLCLFLEVFAGVLEGVAEVFDAAHQFLAGNGAGLRRIEQGCNATDGCTHSQSNPEFFMTHTSSVRSFSSRSSNNMIRR